MASVFLLFMFFVPHLVLLSISAEEKKYNSRCPQFPCGESGPFKFPFNNKTNPECGVFTVDCSEDMPKIQLKEGGHWYEIDGISQADAVWIDDTVRPFYLDSTNSCESIRSFSLPGTSPVFSYTKEGNFSTLFNCSRSLGISKPIDFNIISCGDYEIYYNLQNISFPFEQQCSSIHFPLPLPQDHPDHPDKENPYSSHFTLEVKVSQDCSECHNRGGKCQTISKNQFYCSNEQKGKGREFMVKVAIAAAAAFAGIVTLVIILLCCLRKFSSNGLAFFWKKQSHAHQRIEAFLRICGLHKVRRFSYLDVKKMTNSFKEKLGQGGFGSVYRGKLHDGSLVAVKVLKESKANGEEFINEVATISRTSHVNIVTLLGFCFEGSKKALIYEFMPNGSLEKFVFDENATEKSYQLDWETHYQISLGIARGLEYLHRGCNTRILHFDIKPHNILLDAEFVPKISDFGLAKICTRKDSLISSMLGPRGTIGYIAPEVFNRNFGGVSHKSDVYSYGMMILEMVGGRKNVNVRADNSSELYFPQWIYKRLEVEDLGLKRIMNQEDKIKLRKMIMMSFWCIQTDPSKRPTMSRVIEMLEGSLDSLQVPPKPFFSSPPRSPPSESSSTFASLQV